MRFSIKNWLVQRREPWRRIFFSEYSRWRKDRGERKRANLWFLDANSVVFDIGGYKGEWADQVFDAHACTVHIFEPHPTFASALVEKYRATPKIAVHAFALGSSDSTFELSDEENASSIHNIGGKKVLANAKSVSAFFNENQFKNIDLAKINIEGGEYDLLPALANANLLEKYSVLQIQFHLYAEADIAKRDEIIRTLSKTHNCDWSYAFVWEQWSRK